MSLFKKSPKISVCIPVYGTENVLSNCLESVAKQVLPVGVKDFFEVVVVDDCSLAGTAGKIVKDYKKIFKGGIRFVRHNENKGLVEARRTAVLEAKGEYIFNLDSDDIIPPDALVSLYEKALETGADIVQGEGDVFFLNSISGFDEKTKVKLEEYRKNREDTVRHVYEGELKNRDILDGFLLKSQFNSYLWGKLFRRELYLDAFEHIPPIFNTMAEDAVQFVWLARLANKYCGIKKVVYSYYIDTGVSSSKIIDDLGQWERVCSTASVFTALFSEIATLPDDYFTSEEIMQLKGMCRHYVFNNLVQFYAALVPELKEQGYEMLCDYWGKELVETADKEVRAKFDVSHGLQRLES